MSEPLEYRVLLNLQAALQGIRQANGYFFDVDSTVVKLNPDQGVEQLVRPDGPRPVVFLERKPEQWDYTPAAEQSLPGIHELCILSLPFVAHWFGPTDATVDESFMQTFFRACADVEQAIGADMTRGGLALDTRIRQRRYDDGVNGSDIWAIVEFEVRIVRAMGLPKG